MRSPTLASKRRPGFVNPNHLTKGQMAELLGRLYGYPDPLPLEDFRDLDLIFCEGKKSLYSCKIHCEYEGWYEIEIAVLQTSDGLEGKISTSDDHECKADFKQLLRMAGF